MARATYFTLLFGLLVTVALSASVRRLEHNVAERDFEQRVDARVAAVTRSLDGASKALHAVNLLFAATGAVTREQFDAFAKPLAASNPYIQALVFHRLVLAEERAAFEAQRRKAFPGFSITERTNGGLTRAAARAMYLVDDYLVPMRGNEIALGYDAWSYPPQREITQRAIDTARPAASSIVQLLQDAGESRGIVIVMPVYRRGAGLTDVAARRRAFVGDTEVVINLATLIGRSLKDANLLDTPGIALSVFGSGATEALALAYGSGSAPPGNAAPRWVLRLLSLEGFSHTRTFDVAGQRWRMVISAKHVSMANYLGSLATLLLGALVSLMAAAYTQSGVSRARRIEQLVQDRTADLKRASDALRLHKRAIQSSANAIIITAAAGPDYPIEYVNPAFERGLGYAAADVLGASLRSLAGPEADQPGMLEILSAARTQREGKALLRHLRKDGTVVLSETYIAPVKNESGETDHFVVTQYDVTTTMAYEAELEQHAKFDTLTGLANRSVLFDRLEQAVAFASARSDAVWTVMVDLDHFKFVNDTLGHRAGDALLRALAPRMWSAVRRGDTLARIGGDEFVLILINRDNEGQAPATVRAVMDAIAQPITIEGHDFALTCSAGVAVYPPDGSDTETLIKHAEIAMYRAKELGRNTVQFFTSSMNDRALERLTLESALRSALDRQEFELYYQPQVALASGRVVGMEALIRWRNPQFGMVPPDRFIGIAEETGLIVAIGAWVLRTACAQTSAWQRAGLGQLRVAVNISARQFVQQDLAQWIAGMLDETGLAPHCLELELTESMVMGDVAQAIGTMHALKALGIQLSIDDFGTGHSSLSYLKRFPVDVLKIDQSFVRDIAVNPDDAAVVRAIISLGHSLRLQVIAEGVETEAQFDYLRNHGCDEIQGYLLGPAVSADDFARILQGGRGSSAGEVSHAAAGRAG